MNPRGPMGGLMGGPMGGEPVPGRGPLEPGLGGGGARRPAPGADPAATPNTIKLQRCDFTVHFCWQPKTPSERQAALKAQEKAKTPGQP
jgi:hypothetical protein